MRRNTGKSTTNTQHDFSKNQDPLVQRSVFDRSHSHKTTFNGGELVPIFLDQDILPGDTMHLKPAMFARFATLLRPVMSNAYVTFHFFFIPLRLVYANVEAMFGARDNPDDPEPTTEVPQIQSGPGGFEPLSLADHFGLPINVELEVSALPFRAYNLVWREYYRAEFLQDSPVVKTDDSNDDPADYPIRRRGKRHDYFTACNPFPQAGPDVTFSLGDQAPLVFPNGIVGTGEPTFSDSQSGDSLGRLYTNNPTGIPGQARFESGTENEIAEWDNPHLTAGAGSYADLSDATAGSINELRVAATLQQFLERGARWGNQRYREIIYSMFKVDTDDARLQRPEYLGSFEQPLFIREIPNTSGINVQGDLAAQGTVAGEGGGFHRSFTEHGIILGLASCRADLEYQQGVEKGWLRKNKYDFAWPLFAHLGEEEVRNIEIYASGDPEVDNATFGFQERYASYRHKPGRITGRFRSKSTVPLDYWHWAQDFENLPVLDSTFIEENPPFERSIAVTSEPHLQADIWFDYKCIRPLPVYSTPGIDRL